MAAVRACKIPTDINRPTQQNTRSFAEVSAQCNVQTNTKSLIQNLSDMVYRSNIRRKIATGRYRRVAKLYNARAYGSNTGAPTTSAARTLSRVKGSYRYSNPMLITPSNARTCTFWRSCTHSLAINQNGGFTSGATQSPCLGYSFDLQGVKGFLGGAYNFDVRVSNTSDFQALFDMYKVNAVKMKFFFSHNIAGVTTASQALPLVHIVNDFDDVAENLTLATVLEKAGVRTMQFDATNMNGYNHYIKPAPRVVTSQIDPATGNESVINAGVASSMFIDCAVSNVVHFGTKIVYNNQGRTVSSDIGTMTTVFEIEYVFKGYR